ncbi:PLDc N-terminal domain-containing protein [Patescibacteria group bacterium]|nr:PLDc N-terminal domain-containing protein [Patescibacteria group bacterium]
MLAMLAQSEETISIDPAAANAVGAAAAGVVGIWVFLWIVLVIAALLGLILWIWAIIDVSKREFANPQDKTTWLIVLIVGFVVGLSLIAAIIYLAAGRKKGTMSGTGNTESQTPPQA